jgi:ketosteroid isomerase-like protein
MKAEIPKMTDIYNTPLTVADIENLEEQLRLAMLSSDVETLDRLLADDLVLVDHQGRRLDKKQDLEVHRSGILQLQQIEIYDRVIKLIGNAATVSLSTRISGTYYGEGFSEKFAFSRVWFEDNGRPIVTLAHCTRITM